MVLRWIEDILVDGAPVPITRRYKPEYANASMIGTPIRADQLLSIKPRISSSKKEESDSEEDEYAIGAPKSTKSVKRASSSAGVIKQPKASDTLLSPTIGPKKKPSVHPINSSSGTAKFTTPRKIITPEKVHSAEAKNKRQRNSLGDVDSTDEFEQLASPLKRPKLQKEPEEEERAHKTPKKPRPTSGAYRVNLHAPVRVYLAQATNSQREHYRKLTNGINGLTILDDVTQATHVVYFNPPDSVESKISLSALFAIACGLWILKESWLEQLIEKQIFIAPERHELKSLPGCRASRLAHAQRRQYLDQQGLSETQADDDGDENLPRLIFSDLTFNLDRYKASVSADQFSKVKAMISSCGGKIGTDLTSDIWLVGDADRKSLNVRFSPQDDTPNEEDEIRIKNPTFRKRVFSHALTHRRMPIWALKFDYIRDCLIHWQMLDMDEYDSPLSETFALAEKRKEKKRD